MFVRGRGGGGIRLSDCEKRRRRRGGGEPAAPAN